MLYDDCIARGKSRCGRRRALPGRDHRDFGIVNAGDSLAAIKSLVYERKLMTLEQLVAALDADFEGLSVSGG